MHLSGVKHAPVILSEVEGSKNIKIKNNYITL